MTEKCEDVKMCVSEHLDGMPGDVDIDYWTRLTREFIPAMSEKSGS